MSRVVAVVLTFNRRELLRTCLTAISYQTAPCDGVIVVDNGSSDGTGDMLRQEFSSVEVCRLRENVGAAGGFNLGMRLAVAAGAERIWVMDDDVIADPNALEKLSDGLDFVEQQGAEPPFVISVAHAPGGVLTNVPEIDGSNNALNYPNWPAHLERSLVPVTRSTFVSILIPLRTFKTYGFPLASLFIWGEDSEFTLRVTKREPGYLCALSKVEHVRAQPGWPRIETEKNPVRMQWHKHMVRNSYYTTRQHRSKAALARFVFSTLKRIARMLWRGEIRKARLIGTGLVTGIFFKPQEGKFVNRLQSGAVESLTTGLSSCLRVGAVGTALESDATDLRAATVAMLRN